MTRPRSTGAAVLNVGAALSFASFCVGVFIGSAELLVAGWVVFLLSLGFRLCLPKKAPAIKRPAPPPLSEDDVQRYAAVLGLPAEVIRLAPDPPKAPDPQARDKGHRLAVEAVNQANMRELDIWRSLTEVGRSQGASAEVVAYAARELRSVFGDPETVDRAPAEEASRRAQAYTRAYHRQSRPTAEEPVKHLGADTSVWRPTPPETDI